MTSTLHINPIQLFDVDSSTYICILHAPGPREGVAVSADRNLGMPHVA